MNKTNPDFENFLSENKISPDFLGSLGIYNGLQDIFSSNSNSSDRRKHALELFQKTITPINISRIENQNPDAEALDETKETVDPENAELSGASLVLKPSQVRGKKLPNPIINEEIALKISEEIAVDPFFTVKNITFSKLSFKPKAPFTTSTLQQAASSFLGFNPKSTMSIAQKLYEGVDINGQNIALITYMRTDSVTLSGFVIGEINAFLKKNYPNFTVSVPRIYKAKSKNAQEAHEAIRPTNISIHPNEIRGKIDNSQWRLYDLIWRQTVASQMSDEIREKKAFSLHNSTESVFSGSFIVTIDPGWRSLFPRKV